VRQNLPRKERGGASRRIFFMRKAIAASFLLVLAAACASTDTTTVGSANLKIAKPEILLVQTSNVPTVARFTDGALSIHYAVRVENRASEPITLKRISIQSVSEGAYYVAPESKPFDVKIEPSTRQEVEMWVPAQPGRSLVGVNGPVTLRVTCDFDSPAGVFQEIVMRRVNERADITGAQ
jgi:hypothetical protein